MKFEDKGFENIKCNLLQLDDILSQYGLTRDDHWDYERVTYDRKFELNNEVFYLRIQGTAVEGDVGANKAVIQLMTPILGKYYYPHGVEYGEDENFPSSLLQKCDEILNKTKEEIKEFAN